MSFVFFKIRLAVLLPIPNCETDPARILDFATTGVEPGVIGIVPVPEEKKLLPKTGRRLEDFDLVELNEAFAALRLACNHNLHFDRRRLNPNAGALALGHPIGASGARITATLDHEMKQRQARRGEAALCVSSGLGMALELESA